VYGMPVIFGPHHLKSAEALAMLSHKEWHAAFTINTYEELIAAIQSLLDGDEEYLKIGSQKAKEYVIANTGGTEQIYSWMKRNEWV
jgi:3-deoxy-D-manno-octulosonic-acid transferase